MNRRIIFTFTLLLLTILVSCGNQSKSESNNQKKSSKAFDAEMLHNILVKLNSQSKLDVSQLDSLVFLFAEYEKNGNSISVFPKYENDPELFYSLVEKLKNNSKNEEMSFQLRYIFLLRSKIKRIVEWSEYLSELIHTIALENTISFVNNYKRLDEESKRIILSDLSWLNEYEKVDEFIKKLNKIENDENSTEISEIKNEILDY